MIGGVRHEPADKMIPTGMDYRPYKRQAIGLDKQYSAYKFVDKKTINGKCPDIV
jgi:hypothetical protein